MGETLRILLVDDSPYDRGMVRRELKQEFETVEVIEATNDAEFAAALENPVFDLVITDFQIRWTDGLKVFHAVKERLPDCPVLMFTATGNEEIAVEAMKSGLDDYIIKNVHHLVRLRVAVRSALKHSRTNVRARRLELRLAELLDHLCVGVFRRRLDGTVVDANDAAAQILGLTSGLELAGLKLADSFVQSVIPMAQTPCVGAVIEEVEVPVIRHDRQMVYVSISERRVGRDDGEPLIEGLLEDITSRRDTEDQIRRLQDEMAHVNRLNTMAEMATGIAHELNQPLSAIANYSTVCEKKLRESTDVKDLKLADMINEINEMALQAGSVIRGLRDFTKRRPSRHDAVIISDLIDSSLSMLTFELRSNGVTVAWNPPAGLPQVTADSVQIRQVLVNLMTNAIDAMLTTERAMRQISINVSTDSDAIVVAISDSGCGIENDQWDQLFDSFVTSKPDGTGIGLAISKRIMEAHGGRLTARNNEDAGTTFEFTLPLDVRIK
tara:strand:- start:830 stop:2317 length:1488 start_codon:yes stop_codon:yes gene_type:complete